MTTSKVPREALSLEVRPGMTPKKIGDFLKGARQTAGRTQVEVGKKMGVVANHIARFESGKVEPMLSTIAKFVRALGGTLVIRVEWDRRDRGERDEK
jgi:predicted transcriptional regulator